MRTDGRGGKGVIALKLRKQLEDTLACFRIVGADDEIMLSTTQVQRLSAFVFVQQVRGGGAGCRTSQSGVEAFMR